MSHEIKVNGYKPSKWPSRPEMNVDAHEKPAVQPDWEQNDETASDYIKNRPFYDATIALPKELTTDVQDLVEYRLQPYVGKEFFDHLADYTVRYNGVDYKFDTAKSITFSGATFIGVGCHPVRTAACSPLTSSDVPFTIFRASVNPSVVWDNEPVFIDIHNIVDGNKDIEILRTNVKQIDPKFIPNGLPVINQNIKDGYVPTTHSKSNSAGEEIAQYEMHRPIRVYNVQKNEQGYYLRDNESDEQVTPQTIDFTGTPVILTWNDQYLYQTGPGGMYRYFVSLSNHDVKREGIYVKGYYEVKLNLRTNSVSVSEHASDIQKIRIVDKNNNGTVSFCGILTSNITLSNAKSAYNTFRPYLTFNGEPFITAELIDNSITIVYMGKGEDGQYGVQKTTFGGITWKSETT